MAAVFLWSYALMYAAYTRVYEQDLVRVNIVKSQLSQGHKDFTVPDFHFLKMQNSGGHFGSFTIRRFMATILAQSMWKRKKLTSITPC